MRLAGLLLALPLAGLVGVAAPAEEPAAIGRARAALGQAAEALAVDRMVGETVLAGEPLGALGGPAPQSAEFLLAITTDRDAIRSQSLYIELRRAGEPVDPALWFDLAMQGTEG